jgi:hypothetical protein
LHILHILSVQGGDATAIGCKQPAKTVCIVDSVARHGAEPGDAMVFKRMRIERVRLDSDQSGTG